MRYARRTDSSQKGIVEALRDAGCSVAVISDVGRGVPDLLVGLRCRNFLLECKPVGPPSSKQLTPAEAKWHGEWRGQVAVVSTPDEALAAVSR